MLSGDLTFWAFKCLKFIFLKRIYLHLTIVSVIRLYQVLSQIHKRMKKLAPPVISCILNLVFTFVVLMLYVPLYLHLPTFAQTLKSSSFLNWFLFFRWYCQQIWCVELVSMFGYMWHALRFWTDKLFNRSKEINSTRFEKLKYSAFKRSRNELPKKQQECEILNENDAFRAQST